jgi:hypothetical protein
MRAGNGRFSGLLALCVSNQNHASDVWHGSLRCAIDGAGAVLVTAGFLWAAGLVLPMVLLKNARRSTSQRHGVYPGWAPCMGAPHNIKQARMALAAVVLVIDFDLNAPVFGTAFSAVI